MNILIIGGGVSSCTYACFTKKKHPDYNVTIFERDDKILRRVLVSGNGRCNFFNSEFKNIGKCSLNYSSPDDFTKFVTPSDVKAFLQFVKEDLKLSFYQDEEGRMYPFSNSSQTVVDVMTNYMVKNGIKIVTNSNITNIDVKNKSITDGKKKYAYDHLFIGLGGVSYERNSQQNQGILTYLNLKTIPYESGLCPLITAKRIPQLLVGTRIKGELTLKRNRTEIYKESGELLFKKDGISGIAVFNASMFINLQKGVSYYVSFNPFIHDKVDASFQGSLKLEDLTGIFNPNLIKYLSLTKKKSFTSKDVIEAFTFQIVGKYPLKESQISLGGVELNQINPDLSLISNPDISLGGEMLNLHAKCGGFNMGLAFLFGMKASK